MERVGGWMLGLDLDVFVLPVLYNLYYLYCS